MTNQVEPNPSLLGVRIRPFDPRELPYRLMMPAMADMTEIVNLGAFMPPVRSQEFGSCTGHAVVTAMECLYAHRNMVFPDRLDPYVVYWDARVKQNFFGQGWGADTGAYDADAFDVALTGVPRDSLWDTPRSAAEAPPDSIRADAAAQDWLLGHQPMYSTDPGGFLAGVWSAIKNFQPVGMATAWYNNWFDHHAVLRDDTGHLAGYHEICIYACIPAGILHPEPGVVFRNSWGAYTDVTELRQVIEQAQPGDVFMPQRHFLNGTVNSLRAATAEPIPIPPADCAAEVQAAREEAAEIVIQAASVIRSRGGA